MATWNSKATHNSTMLRSLSFTIGTSRHWKPTPAIQARPPPALHVRTDAPTGFSGPGDLPWRSPKVQRVRSWKSHLYYRLNHTLGVRIRYTSRCRSLGTQSPSSGATGGHLPNPFLLNTELCGYYSDTNFRWGNTMILESEDAYPHLTIQAYQPINGQENRILYGELVLLLDAMRNRAIQLDVTAEDEQELLFNPGEEDIPVYGRKFPQEYHFPVLLLSYVGPQHGRVLYAAMDGDRLVIRQSKLYSFEKEVTAPIGLFGRLLPSKPLSTSI
ncbi:hypothetical protein BO71DRAFT_398986 [Aspergillus ellipticus CBS 707.79]|uniref:Uncharacterized protein n=1 Tax=Aspergillus ellipticus CBS 707.79 TaxID=1448320 RepID=A0A319DAU4_9EURO|nr:hypothetical protein BO71DRAFT_398986 [Aspergillus ellipticus CBS 707.79]